VDETLGRNDGHEPGAGRHSRRWLTRLAAGGLLTLAFVTDTDAAKNRRRRRKRHQQQRRRKQGQVSGPQIRVVMAWGEHGSGPGEFNEPQGIAIDHNGHVYVVDTGNSRIQKFTANGTFLTKWGSQGVGDGQFNRPIGVAVDRSSDDVYVAERNRIQKFG
jgi:DNA-binding beta-propeller fold protein YncE